MVDDAAFERLVDAHYKRTYGLILRMVRNEADAADLTQDVFVRVYRSLPRLRAEEAAGPWIRRIATNLSLDFLRRRKAHVHCVSLDAELTTDSDSSITWEIADPSAQPERLLDSAESVRLLHKAVDSLPEDYRVVIVLHHMQELPVDEIAAALRVPAGTIKSRLSRARRELRRKLSPFFDPNLVTRP
jgi:RNA polymerase sigma-70 factor (ECF subfamily)